MNGERIAVLIKTASIEFDKMTNPMLADYDLTASQCRVLKFSFELLRNKWFPSDSSVRGRGYHRQDIPFWKMLQVRHIDLQEAIRT